MHLVGPQELLLILLIVVLLFGAKKIPELARGLGSGLKEFKKATKDVERQVSSSDDTAAKPPAKEEKSA